MQHTIAQKFRPTELRLSPFARTVSRDTHLVFQPSVVEFHLRVPRRVTPGVSPILSRGLPQEMSNFDCLPGRAGGSPFVLTRQCRLD